MISSKKRKNRIRKLEYNIECLQNYIHNGRTKFPMYILSDKKKKSLKKQLGLLKSAEKHHKLKLFRQIFMSGGA